MCLVEGQSVEVRRTCGEVEELGQKIIGLREGSFKLGNSGISYFANRNGALVIRR